MTADVKPFGLSGNGVVSHFTPNDVASGRYLLEGYLYVYVNRAPDRPLEPLIDEYLRLILSRPGAESGRLRSISCVSVCGRHAATEQARPAGHSDALIRALECA